MKRLQLALTALAIAAVAGSWASAAEIPDPLNHLDVAIPHRAREFRLEAAERLANLVDATDDWAANLIWQHGLEDADAVHAAIAQLVMAKQRVDDHLDRTLALRSRFAELPDDARRHDQLHAYLLTASHLIDLSGRLRYVLRDAVNNASFAWDSHPDRMAKLVDLLTREKVSIGAAVMAFVLFDPPEGTDVEPYPDVLKRNVLELMGAGGSAEVLPDLAEFVRQESTGSAMTVRAVEIIRRIGVPQRRRSGQDPRQPPPPITPRELRGILASRPLAPNAPELQRRRDDLLDWLAQRSERGVVGDTFRVDGFDIRVGDWLLMRNPSPYNLFTDLSPGLFTHVGVVATETGDDGVRRFVVVDLPERGERIPATPVDTYLLRTVHYAFLRHRDARIGQIMGQVAGSVIGNESQFDLTFRTARVQDLRGRLHEGTVIHTYCAGFLLLCAQETGASREELFPIVERAAGGKCAANLAKLGLSIGDDFISPTGAMFSPHLTCVGRREAMYTPDRAIKESIYDHFAHCMITEELHPSPDVYQSLRQTAAALARQHPWLARALARANNVSEHVDLESAAKAAAVIETLDEIADRNMHEFVVARHALMSGPLEQRGERNDVTRTQITEYRLRHAELYQQWTQRRLSARQLRVALVEYYQSQGHNQIGQRFFRK
ncbi:MAG: hypothetical protein ACC628_13320 [Pirellulaceae bacterium]